MTGWRSKTASALLALVAVAGAVRLANGLLAPAVPVLVMVGGLAAVYLFLVRPGR